MTAIDEADVALPPLFTAGDRCDACGAQAKMRALLSGGFLLFCGHHGHEYKTGLEALNAVMEGDTHG